VRWETGRVPDRILEKIIMRLSTLALALAVLLGWGLSPATAGNKVDVCHVDGSGGFQMINVSVNAANAHLGHGDFLPADDNCDPDDDGPPEAEFPGK